MLIEDMVDSLAQFLREDPQIVFSKLEREIFNKGITVADAWNTAGPKTSQEIIDFYRTTDSYLYDLLIDHHGQFRRQVRERILHQLKQHNAKRVLDYGGGIGLDSIAMCRAGIDVTYLELEGVTSRFAEWSFAREGCNIEVVHSSESLRDVKYDGAVCIEVLEHVPDPMRVIEDIKHSLKTGGVALLSESFGSVGTSYPSHLASNRKYTGKIFTMMEKCGFALTMRPPDEKPLEFVKMNQGAQFRILQWKRRLEVSKDLVHRALAYSSKLR